MANLIAFIGSSDFPLAQWLKRLLAERGMVCVNFKSLREFRDARPNAKVEWIMCGAHESATNLSGGEGRKYAELHSASLSQDVVGAMEDIPLATGHDSHMAPGGKHGRFRRLTRRELQTLGLIAQGRSSKQIAQELGIALRTVANHRASIRSKTGINSVAQLVSAYLQLIANPPKSA